MRRHILPREVNLVQTFFAWAAAFVSIGAVLAHVVAGGRAFVVPFLANDIPNEKRWMAYFAWHTATLSRHVGRLLAQNKPQTSVTPLLRPDLPSRPRHLQPTTAESIAKPSRM